MARLGLEGNIEEARDMLRTSGLVTKTKVKRAQRAYADDDVDDIDQK